jgi:hypothetical protein
MSRLFTAFLAIALCLSLSLCKSHDKPPRKIAATSSLVPEFTDNGKVMDSLKGVYRFESIEYENWDDDDATDSSLTVSFINSKKLPSTDVDATVKEFRGIASSIRRSIVDTNRYKSYNIIFLARDTMGMMTTSSHTAGMDVPVKELRNL